MTAHLFYSTQWQVLEERTTTGTFATPTAQATAAPATYQYVWSPVYVDAMICRDTLTSIGTLSQRLYVQQDANFNVTALLEGTPNNPALGTVRERFNTDAYGGNITTWVKSGNNWTQGTDTFHWKHFHKGGRYDPLSTLYNFRNREYSPTLMRWMQEDPAGDVDGMNTYLAVGENPVIHLDPMGLDTILGIHSNARPSSGDMGAAEGHSWLTTYDTDTKEFHSYGQWPGLATADQIDQLKNLVGLIDSGTIMQPMQRAPSMNTSVRFDREKDIRNKYIDKSICDHFKKLDCKQAISLKKLILKPVIYVGVPGEKQPIYECTTWAVDVWNGATGKALNANEKVLGVLFASPRRLTRAIWDAEKINSTKTLTPPPDHYHDPE